MDNNTVCLKNMEQASRSSYPGLKRLTEKEAESANKERNELLEYLSGKVNRSFMQSKLHIGELSPGCAICGGGRWSCMFINGLCTANCFYCPQDRKIKKERLPWEDVCFDKPEQYVAYLEKFNFKGVGFSGGEPLLAFGRLLTYIKKIKERFGKSMYLWVYTNGNLVTEDKLRELSRSGLDEIRFNISADNYDLRRAGLAAGIIKTVTVEIPSIPEDHEIVKKCLAKMGKMGIKHLNIHQLNTTQYNYKNFIRRGYTFLKYSGDPILESEMSALRLLKYAVDNKIGLPVNYCSAVYKDRFQGKGRRQRKAYSVKKDFEELTGAKFIRSLSVRGAAGDIKKIIDALRSNNCPEYLWLSNDAKTEIFIHGSLLKYIDFDVHDLIVSYFNPLLITEPARGEFSREIEISPERKVFIKRELVFRQKLAGNPAVETFRRIFIKNLSWMKCLNYLYRNYDLKGDNNLGRLRQETVILFALKAYEKTGKGLAEIY